MPSFARLQKRGRLTRRTTSRVRRSSCRATYYAFDLLGFGDSTCARCRCTERQDALRTLLPTIGPLRYSAHVEAHGEAMFVEAERLGLEGVLAQARRRRSM